MTTNHPAPLDGERRAVIYRLTERLGLPWREDAAGLLDEALTHRSYRIETGVAGGDYERLEWLGDAVVSLLMAEYLLEENPTAGEGELSKRRAASVSDAVLGDVAIELGFGEAIRLGAGEDRGGGRTRPSILGSALEAFLGAAFLGHPFGEVRRAVRDHVIPSVLAHAPATTEDYKSRLQEWCQARHLPLPIYRVVGESGPDHRRIFTIEAWVRGSAVGRGSGPRKRAAQNAAAREALARLEGNGGDQSGEGAGVGPDSPK